MLLTADEVIQRFFTTSSRMSAHKLYRLAKKRRIPSIKLDGRVFFPEEELKAWIATESRVQTSSAVLKVYGRDKASDSLDRLRVINE